MAEKLSTGVIVAIVGAVAAAVVVPAWNWITGGWGRVVEIAGELVAHLGSPSQWPNWIVYLCAATAGLFVCGLVVNWYSSRQVEEPWRRFTSARFFGVDWSWRYSDTNQIVDVAPYCPACQMVLEYEETGDIMPFEIPRVRLRCADCDRWFAEQRGDFRYMKNCVVRYIERDLRTGEFEKKLNAS